MGPNSSLGKICLGEDVVVISSDKVKGSRDWTSLEFQDTANSGQKKAIVFYQMDTKEVSDRFVAPCFVNELEAYDGEINLGVQENMISNEYAVKLCLEHEVKRGNKVVKKELIVALRSKIYFVKFIINPEEDDVEPGVIFGRSFLRLTKRNDDWDHLLDFNIDDIPLLGEEGLSLFVCKMRKSSRNKKRATENLNFFYQDIGTSSSAEDKVEVDAKILKEEEEDVKRIKGDALKEQEDPRAKAMGILINVLCQVGVTTLIAKFLILDIQIDRDSPIVVGRGFLRTIGAITMGTNDNEVGSSQSKRSTHENVEEVLLPQVYHEFLLWEGCNKDVKSRMGYDKEINDMLRIRISVHEAESDEEIFTIFDDESYYELQTKKIITFRLGGRAHSLTLLEFTRRLGLYQAIELEEDGFNVYFEGGDCEMDEEERSCGEGKDSKESKFAEDLDTTTLRDLIDSDGKLIPKDPQPGVPRVGIPRPSRASMQDLYDMMGRMEIRQEAIERMKYRQSYH
ncbi:hypothetical protein Tco_0656186 [Tanacetum coccineum]|uniref:Uncharacterized protein n=1 Tax=Tanacetum coccineum TaxID=301880 RepID=A0ABQ4X8G7_9ASTR